MHKIVAPGKSYAATFVEPVIAPVLKPITVQFDYGKRVRFLVSFSFLGISKDTFRRTGFQIRYAGMDLCLRHPKRVDLQQAIARRPF
jgi:hypothetical protein